MSDGGFFVHVSPVYFCIYLCLRIPKDLPWLPENTELQLEVKIPLAEGEGPDRAQGIWKWCFLLKKKKVIMRGSSRSQLQSHAALFAPTVKSRLKGSIKHHVAGQLIYISPSVYSALQCLNAHRKIHVWDFGLNEVDATATFRGDGLQLNFRAHGSLVVVDTFAWISFPE